MNEENSPTKSNKNDEKNEHYSKQPGIDESSPSLLKNRNFVTLWIGQVVSNIGSFFAFIAILFLTLRLSDNLSPSQQAQALAIVTLIQLIPTAILGPFSGVFVDRFDRKKIMIGMDIIGALTSLSMVFANSLGFIYSVVGMYSIVRIFFNPAKNASIPLIVTPDKITQANSFSQTTMQLSKIIGPALSGFVVALYGIQSAFYIDAVSFILSAICISLITTNLKPTSTGESMTVKNTIHDLKVGFSLSINDPILRFVFISMFIFMVGASMIDPLFAFYLSNEFGLGEKQFGLIISLSALTGFASAVFLSLKGNINNKLLVIISTLLIGGISIAIIGLAPHFTFGTTSIMVMGIGFTIEYPIVALYLGMALVGVVNVILMIPLSSLIQTIVEDANMGKVNGILGALLSFTQIGGAALATSLVIFVSVSTLYTICGIFLVTSFGFLYFVLNKYDLDSLANKRQDEMMVIKQQEYSRRKETERVQRETKQGKQSTASVN